MLGKILSGNIMALLCAVSIYFMYTNQLIVSSYNTNQFWSALIFAFIVFWISRNLIFEIIWGKRIFGATTIIGVSVFHYIFFSDNPAGYWQVFYIFFSLFATGAVFGVISQHVQHLRKPEPPA